ncbi:hypothetical protein Tco_0448144 [Tanacetum coccineum]
MSSQLSGIVDCKYQKYLAVLGIVYATYCSDSLYIEFHHVKGNFLRVQVCKLTRLVIFSVVIGKQIHLFCPLGQDNDSFSTLKFIIGRALQEVSCKVHIMLSRQLSSSSFLNPGVIAISASACITFSKQQQCLDQSKLGVEQ